MDKSKCPQKREASPTKTPPPTTRVTTSPPPRPSKRQMRNYYIPIKHEEYAREILSMGDDGGFRNRIFKHLPMFTENLQPQYPIPKWLKSNTDTSRKNLFGLGRSINWTHNLSKNITWFRVSVRTGAWASFYHDFYEPRKHLIYVLPNWYLCKSGGEVHRHMLCVVEQKFKHLFAEDYGHMLKYRPRDAIVIEDHEYIEECPLNTDYNLLYQELPLM